jgi:malonyl-CoA O-methyltransferase
MGSQHGHRHGHGRGGGRRDLDFSAGAERYDSGASGRVSRQFHEAVVAAAPLGPGARVLDVGCGTGALLRRLMAARPGIEASGVDVAAGMLVVARRACPGATILEAPAEALPFGDGAFDLVTACLAFHHFPDQTAFAREAARVLRPGGTLLIAEPRFASPLRRFLNGLFRAHHVVGEFAAPAQIAAALAPAGFTPAATTTRRYVQVVTLHKQP